MYIRRKVFSVLVDETGEERLFSVNETIIEEQREFGAHKRKQNRKITRELKYQEINENKALKAQARAEANLAKGNIEAAEVATKKAQKKAQESMKNAQRFDERVGTAAKTRKSIDSAEGLNLKREGKLHNTTTNIKRDLAGNQTTAVQEVVAKHDVIPGTTEKVAKRRSVFVERNPNAPSSPANPLNTTTRAQAQEARHARRLKNKNAGNVVSETVTKGYKGGVNGKPVVVQEVKKVVTPTENGAVNVVREVTKKSAPVEKKAVEEIVRKSAPVEKKAVEETVKKSGKKFLNPAKWSKNAKIGAGIAAGTAVLGTGAYLAKKHHDKK